MPIAVEGVTNRQESGEIDPKRKPIRAPASLMLRRCNKYYYQIYGIIVMISCNCSVNLEYRCQWHTVLLDVVSTFCGVCSMLRVSPHCASLHSVVLVLGRT